jgi:hypothetical protein
MGQGSEKSQAEGNHRPDSTGGNRLQLLVELDPDTLQMSFVLKCQNLEIALAMARWAADELKRRCDRAWIAANETRIALPGRVV